MLMFVARAAKLVFCFYSFIFQGHISRLMKATCVESKHVAVPTRVINLCVDSNPICTYTRTQDGCPVQNARGMQKLCVGHAERRNVVTS